MEETKHFLILILVENATLGRNTEPPFDVFGKARRTFQHLDSVFDAHSCISLF